jgi:beta-galactosidase
MGKFLMLMCLLWAGFQTLAFSTRHKLKDSAYPKREKQYWDQEISLNGIWQFKTDAENQGENQQWFANNEVKFSDALTVPGNWNTLNRYANYTGKAWYKKTINIPANLKGRLIRLYFEGVSNDSKVWVNGQFVVANNTGYLDFEKNISGLLKYGETNTITVSVENSFKVGALWNWGGIRRPVKLLVNSLIYIKQNLIEPKIDLNKRTADVNLSVMICNNEMHSRKVNGKVLVFQQKKLLKTVPFSANIGAGSAQLLKLKTQLTAGQVQLWSLDNPQLYTCKVMLSADNLMIDEQEDRFGLRTVELDKVKHQLKLNGEVIRPIGFNLVPDDRTTGNTLPLWRVKEDIDLMKALGAGVARMSHVPYHKEMLDYLDEKGILIIEEIPVWGETELVKRDQEITNGWLKRMVNDHFNHPCIFGWSVGNEIGRNADVMDYVETAIKYARPLDTARMHVMVSHTATREKDPLQLSDLGFINWYGLSGSYADKVHSFHPGSTLFFSEFGYNQLSEDLATDFPIKALMESISHKPYVIGASLWTFNDYRSDYTGTKEFSQNRPWGIVDVFRQKKKAYYSFRNANMPFATIALQNEVSSQNNKEVNATLALKPHDVLDIPAYPLHGYRVVWKVLDDHNKITGGSSKTLPDIMPGAPEIKMALSCKITGRAPVMAVASIVSPLNYTLYDTTVYFRKPEPARVIAAYSTLNPNINGTDNRFIKVLYEKNTSAYAFKVRYAIDNAAEQETAISFVNYINIPNLKLNQQVKLSLVSLNSNGETSTAILPIKVTGSDLRPFIQYTEPADKGFFIGFETLKTDDKITVQVTEKSDHYVNAKEIIADTKGVIKVEGLANGKQYYYRVKRGAETNNWSTQIAVMPDGGLKPVKPFIQGLFINDRDAIICFTPVKKSVGYSLQYKSAAETAWHSELITSSQITQYQFKIKNNAKTIQVKLAALNEQGQSAYAEFTAKK